MSVFLVRHGEVHNPHHIVYADLPGYRLSELGRQQATEARDFLRGRSLAAIVASPLERAQQTAAVIAQPHGLTVTTDDEVTEWRMAQRWKGLVWEDLDTHLPGDLTAYLDHPWDLPWSEESLEALATRMVKAVTRLADAAGGPIAVVSHQDPIQAGRLALTGQSLQTLNVDKPAHAEVFELEYDDPWREVDRWAPTVQVEFPPPRPGASD